MLDDSECWVDRREEAALLRTALRERRSVLVWGPAGAGKTALVDHVNRETDAGAKSGLLRLSGCPIVQDARGYGLVGLDLRGFREELLRWSGRLPGAIIKMCALASRPQYQYGGRIKTRLLYIDYQMSLLPGSSKTAGAR
jgi:hypothetical protein